MPRGAGRYSGIILVAHSLGALIAREALLFANRDKENWLSTTRMILFAPAHKGARIIELANKCLPGFYSTLGFVAHWFIPVLGDLKENSEPIKEIIKRTEDLLREGKGDFTKAFLSIHAIKDKIIIGGLYCGDPTPEADNEKNHVTLCKVDISSFVNPFTCLMRGIN